MASSKEIGPYVLNSQQGSTVLETTTILSNILRPAGYSRDIINDLAVNLFLENEQRNIATPANMHLLALKKALLYAIPVLAKPGSNTGISLTSQVASQAIQYDSKHNAAKPAAVMIGDKFRLIGLAFPSKLVNHLSHNIFPWKYFHTLPIGYNPDKIDLSALPEIETQQTSLGPIYLIKSKFYEDASLFNMINKLIAYKLNETMSGVLFSLYNNQSPIPLPELSRIDAFNNLSFLNKLNNALVQKVDSRFTMAFYEALHLTANWLLYDQIELLGFSAPEVSKRLASLEYVKEQKLQVQANIRNTTYQNLLNTRAEKLTRERYPYYFDYTDRRALFVRFKRFSIDKLPKKEQAEIKLLLEKDLAAQHAILHNSCEHLQHMKAFRADSHHFKTIAAYINYDSLDEDKMYSCKLCTYPLLCAHEVELYDALQVNNTSAESRNEDQEYWIRQKIINQYKLVNQKRSGDEDTEVSFTYYCRYCGGELGKTNDVIQASMKTNDGSSMVNADDPNETSIYMAIASAITLHVNQAIVPMSKSALIKLIFGECKSDIMHFINRATKSERDNIDTLIRYLGTVYALASLISINVNKLKSSESILILGKPPDKHKPNNDVDDDTPEDVVDTPDEKEALVAVGAGPIQLKDELKMALKIIKTNTTLKYIGVTEDKIKSMLIEAFKYVNRIFADEAIQLKTSTPRDRLTLNIQSSPLLHYATYMYRRMHKWKDINDIWRLTGIDLDVLYPKKRNAEKLSTHALYANIFTYKPLSSDARERYISDSYKSIVELATLEPIKGKYISVITPPLSEHIQNFESICSKGLKIKRSVPIKFLPVKNDREYDFNLKIYQIAYCLPDEGVIRPHRWMVTKSGSKLVYTCKYCKLDIAQATKSNNDKIEDGLDDQMMMEAFFELYTLSCPIKDAHVFEGDSCEQCGATKAQLDTHDPKYYKKYLSTYDKHRQVNTAEILENAATIVAYAKPVANDAKINKDAEKPDLVKLESLANSLGKLYNISDIQSIIAKEQTLNTVESYVRLFYSHYTFAKNASIDMLSHPDPEFYAFVKKHYLGGNARKPKLSNLPDYLTSTDPHSLMIKLLQTMHDMIESGNEDATSLIGFILKKIVSQEELHKAFNFAKLKAVNAPDDMELETLKVEDDEQDDEELDMFDGYDIGADDMEDNMDSFKD